MYLLHPGRKAYETVFFPVLSTENAQDGRVVYRNTELVLEQIANYLAAQKKAGSKIGAVVSEIEGIPLKELFGNTDGCAEQYKCGTALFMLWKLAKELNIVFDRAIGAGGHGKRIIDGLGGDLNHFLEKNLRGKMSLVDVFFEGLLLILVFFKEM